MNSIIKNIQSILQGVVETARFNADDLMAVLQALCGFASSAVTRDPLGLVDVGLGVSTLSTGFCPIQSLETNVEKLRKWLTFGQSYQALADSSELDFDRVDVTAIPDVMKVSSIVQNLMTFKVVNFHTCLLMGLHSAWVTCSPLAYCAFENRKYVPCFYRLWVRDFYHA